jgi:mono/diheme cytochrome c family protein
MKLTQAIVVAAMMILCVGTTFGEVVIREVQLRWEDVAKLDGDVVFNNLCAVCHGVGGKGDGPAVSTLGKAVPDLTVLARNNDGVYSQKYVENVIFGRFRDESEGKSKMPYWGEHFLYLRTGVSGIPRKGYAWERTRTLATYVESLQVK